MSGWRNSEGLTVTLAQAIGACVAVAQISCYTELVANLTITVDEEVLKRARIRALEQGTSVNAVLAERLAGYAGESSQQEAATQRLRTLSNLGKAPTKKRRRPSRDELHER